MNIILRTLTLPLRFATHRIRLGHPHLRKDGIRIIGEADAPQRTVQFFAEIMEALELIQSSDTRRYRRIERVVRIIVSRPLPHSAQWQSFKTCSIDFPSIAQKYPSRKQRIALLCCILIHETTHGELERKGHRYTPATYLRHERLCCLEAMRFAKRITDFYPHPDRCASPYNPDQLYPLNPRQMVINFKKVWSKLRKLREDADSKG